MKIFLILIFNLIAITMFSQSFAEVFIDDFNLKRLDKSKWIDVNRTMEPCNLESFPIRDGSNFLFTDDEIKLQTIKHDPPYGPVGCDWYGKIERAYGYTSADMFSNEPFHFGIFESRLKVPSGFGYWTSFWMYGQSGQEIDIMECRADNYYEEVIPNTSHTKHKISYKRKVDEEKKESNKSILVSPFLNTNNLSNYHIYGILWSPYRLIFYLDSRIVRWIETTETLGIRYIVSDYTINEHSTIPSIINYKYFPTLPMHILITAGTHDIFSNHGPESVDNNKLVIDYVRVIQPLEELKIIKKLQKDDTYNFYQPILANNIYIGGDNANPITVPTDWHLRMQAKDRITILPGFHVKQGGEFHASVKPFNNFSNILSNSFISKSKSSMNDSLQMNDFLKKLFYDSTIVVNDYFQYTDSSQYTQEINSQEEYYNIAESTKYSNDEIVLKMGTEEQGYYFIYNAYGALVAKGQVNIYRSTVNLNGFSTGIYFVSILTNKQVFNLKFLKK